MKMKMLFKLATVVALSLALGGCTFIFQKGRRSDIEKIEKLSNELDELSRAKMLLEQRLSQEIKDKQVSLTMSDKGLVISVLGDILFDSGKASIRNAALPILDKISVVLKETTPDLDVGIEGHTDNQPIQYSGWKSNWELSTARSLSVLHYISDNMGVAPQRLVAIGYGEYRPVAANITKSGQQLNRRVEIIILPVLTKLHKSFDSGMLEPQEDYK